MEEEKVLIKYEHVVTGMGSYKLTRERLYELQGLLAALEKLKP